MQTCRVCNQDLPLNAFGRNVKYSNGKARRCKSCEVKRIKAHQTRFPERAKLTRKKSGIQKHGISYEVYEQMLAKQSNLCALCHRPEKEQKRLCIDHNHSCCKGSYSCGKCVRGLLCNRCNRLLGLFERDGVTIQDLVNYLSIQG